MNTSQSSHEESNDQNSTELSAALKFLKLAAEDRGLQQDQLTVIRAGCSGTDPVKVNQVLRVNINFHCILNFFFHCLCFV